MSSITRFIRQRNTENSYLLPATVLSFNSLVDFRNVFEFIPSASNTAGNYAPGTMVLATGISGSNVITTLQNIIAYLSSSTTFSTSQTAALNLLVLRDLGKTIRTTVATTSTNALVGTTVGTAYFRQVQLLYPTAISYIASPSSNLFGQQLNSASDLYSSYVTFYIPVVVDNIGVNGLTGISASVLPIGVVSGQM
jgi:hypothetical protein